MIISFCHFVSFAQSDNFYDSVSVANTDTVHFLVHNTLEEKKYVFEPCTNLTIENFTYREDASLTDSAYWSMIQPYYINFDSMKVNPYGIDAVKYTDTLRFDLCATEIGSYPYSMPIDSARITSHFGARRYRWHYGTDIKLEIGDTVRSVFDGIVRIKKYNYRGYGNYVVVRHYNGLETLYGHLSEQSVRVGQVVKAGDIIGLGGNTGRSTGAHLHFEVRYQGNAIDTEQIFDFNNYCLRDCEFDLKPSHYDYERELRKKQYHTIRSGDCLSKLAMKYHTSISSICSLNGISRSYLLQIGKKLRVR